MYGTLMIQWNPSCEATPYVSEKWPYKRGGLSSGVKINTFMFRFTLSSGLSRGSDETRGISTGVPLYIIFKVVCVLNKFVFRTPK